MPELTLEEPERLAVETLDDLSPSQDPGFLRLVRRRFQLRLADGRISEPFVYDAISRKALDAVVIVPHFVEEGRRFVYLISSVRPPLALRDDSRMAGDGPTHAVLWELPAGLIEPEELGVVGARTAAKRELFEEIGFDVPEGSLTELGRSSFPAPGVIGERHFFFEVEVAPSSRQVPGLDGSVLEQHGRVGVFEVEAALLACREGRLEDAKTELGLRRLKERFA
ncbi:MAG: NUDIX domain-containing protein [Polyangiaceae bacterium]|nr:NUDIX domain-containing protein [Polyangiaceae bacterium]